MSTYPPRTQAVECPQCGNNAEVEQRRESVECEDGSEGVRSYSVAACSHCGGVSRLPR